MPVELKRCRYPMNCQFCKAEGVKERADWMSKYAPERGHRDPYKHYACSEHKHLIEDTDPDRVKGELLRNVRQSEDDGHMTEADYQTWGHL